MKTITEDQIAAAKALIAKGYSGSQAAREVGVSPSGLRYHLNGRQRASGNGPRPAGILDADERTVTAVGPVGITDPAELMRELGLDPEEWEPGAVVVNRWGGPDAPAYQLKLRLARKGSFVTPAVHVPPVEVPDASHDLPTNITVVVGDQQVPYHDPVAHRLFCQWLADVQPHRGILAGDTLDLPTISRHRDNPEWHRPVQECIDQGYRVLRDYVEASPATRWHKLLGNHDERIRNELLNRAERLYGVRPAATEGEPYPEDALSISRLLHLPDLGIQLVVPHGGYQHAQISAGEGLIVRHGWLVGANSAEKSLRHFGGSLIFGHTHRQSHFMRTVWMEGGERFTQHAVEAGCMCRLEGGLGYAVDPSWQQGFATVSHSAGGWSIDLACFEDGRLRWQGEAWA